MASATALKMDYWQQFSQVNLAYARELYQRFQRDPGSVDAATRALFERYGPPPDEFTPAGPVPGITDHQKIVAVANLAQAIRSFGYRAAHLDPLGTPPPNDPWLDASFHGIDEEDLQRMPASLVGGPVASQTHIALEAIQTLQRIYCSAAGYDYAHIHIPEELNWLRDAAESGQFRPPDDPQQLRLLLERLTQVEVFERFLHRIFPGKTRFSIEGLDTMVPILDEIIGAAAEEGICMIFLGMSHRGRLNVLTHVLGKPYAEILAEFRDPRERTATWDDLGWTGDVTYHKGALHAIEGEDVVKLVISMPPNPSHLEHIDPVVEGMAHSADCQMDQAGPPIFHPKAALPILIHGDASFPGQGVVAETLNLSGLDGYGTGGTIHIIGDNQLGYTALPDEIRSTLYASDLAEGFRIPVMHVNADDPQACLEAARTAFAYRKRFQKDFLIHLVGYRRYGHNEGDEPSFTQPRMYQQIEAHPTVRQLWAGVLLERGHVPPSLPDELVKQDMEALQKVYESLDPVKSLVEPHPQPPPPGAARHVDTAISLEDLRQINQTLLTFPDGFHLHRKLERAIQQRRQALDDPQASRIDWTTAEELALATILADGIPIRLTGEDVVRGTFSQRHASFYDFQTDEPFTPLHALPQAKAAFELSNSPLTENAAVGFEFGYNLQSPDRLVIWEAQYGDFLNIAQIMLDEFVLSARAKWGQTPSLVLLLPHGNEGQGPDHSSARPERFLQLAAETNFRLANPTHAAQYFHLLRRQAMLLKTDPLPLVILTPKGLLRHPLVASTPQELSTGRWQPVIDDPLHSASRQEVRRLLLCSGRIFTDLAAFEGHEQAPHTSIAQVEQLYPFPGDELVAVFNGYPQLEEVFWVQEEPQNMGAWEFIRPRLLDLLAGRWPLHYVGRPPSSSPAEGSVTLYQATQKALAQQAYSPRLEAAKAGVILERG